MNKYYIDEKLAGYFLCEPTKTTAGIFSVAFERIPSANYILAYPMVADSFAKNNMQDKEQQRRQKLLMIEDWQQSGLSQKQYCLEHTIAYHVFHYWYKRSKSSLANKVHEPAAFVKLTAPATDIHTQLVWPDGKRLVFHQPVSSDYLKALLV